jgi:hypothetical protein
MVFVLILLIFVLVLKGFVELAVEVLHVKKGGAEVEELVVLLGVVEVVGVRGF